MPWPGEWHAGKHGPDTDQRQERSRSEGARDFLVASLEALSHLYANRGEQMPDLPTWKLLTEALVMASGYE